MTGRNSLLFLLLFICGIAYGQDEEPIVLVNPSFEDLPRASKTPKGWLDCGFPSETPPDIQPGDPLRPIFGNTLQASHGNTYLGLVVRDNDTWERVSQRLSAPIEKGKCYEMSMYLARARNYISLSRKTNRESNYSEPAKIRIYGGNGYCNKKELLAESDMVKNYEWERYDFKIEQPKSDYSYIIVEAFYKTPALFLYNGNILIDNISPIQPVLCPGVDPQPYVAFSDPAKGGLKVKDIFYRLQAKVKYIDTKSQLEFLVNGRKNTRFTFDANKGLMSAGVTLKEGKNEFVIRGTNKAGSIEDQTSIVYVEDNTIADVPKQYEDTSKPEDPFGNPVEEPEPTIIPELADVKSLKEGQKLKINKLYFEADSFNVTQVSYPVLAEIHSFMEKNRSVVIEVGGHTNDRCADDFCNELSTKRAKAVVDYLVAKGISSKRLSYKGYGKNDPLGPNRTTDQRRKNQRVQIKIISLDG